MSTVVVSEWPRREGEVVRVTLDEFKGNPTVDIRTWWQDEAGNWRPGRSGFTIGRAHLQRLAMALVDAHELDVRAASAPPPRRPRNPLLKLVRGPDEQQ